MAVVVPPVGAGEDPFLSPFEARQGLPQQLGSVASMIRLQRREDAEEGFQTV